MAELVSGDEVSEVNVGGLDDAADESDAFGIRNCVGKRLGECAVARKFENAVLRELVGTVNTLIVVESGARAGEHVVDVVRVSGVVINLKADVTVGPVVSLLPALVVAGDVGEEVHDMSRAHAVFVEVAAVGLPLALQVAGSDGDLVLRGADDGVVSDPVRLALKKDVVHGVRGIAPVGHFYERRKVFFAAAAGVGQLDPVAITDVGDIAGVEKGAVVGELRGLVSVAKAVGLVAH